MTTAVRAPVRLAILGAGGRGFDTYGSWIAQRPDRAQVVAVADPVPERRNALSAMAWVPPDARYGTWEDLLDDSQRLELEGVIVALPDSHHVAPTVAAVELGLPVLLEKPVAPSPESLADLYGKVAHLQPRIAVAHVLRETPFWRSIHQLVASGALGDVATVRLDEGIGYWHFAHSFVRGNWRRADLSSPMVLAKTCHDLDILRWLVGRSPVSVTSVGSLLHFRAENAPAGAPDFCVEGCPAAAQCPFHAGRFYVDRLLPQQSWWLNLIDEDPSPDRITVALERSPYGRCVYRCDNDVADHQQTLVDFGDGVSATLTASAFTGEGTRRVHVTGTRGEVVGHMRSGELLVSLFAPDAELAVPFGFPAVETMGEVMGHREYRWTVIPDDHTRADHKGHGGGDAGLIDTFVTAVSSGDFHAHVDTTLEASLDSHWMAFAAEDSRATGSTIRMRDQGYRTP